MRVLFILYYRLSSRDRFFLALLLMSGIRERLELTDTPANMKGSLIAFIVASLMSLAFMGFSGFKF